MYVTCHESHYVHELEFYFTNKKCFETGRVLKNNHVKKEKKAKVNSQEVRKICLPTQLFGHYLINSSKKN